MEGVGRNQNQKRPQPKCSYLLLPSSLLLLLVQANKLKPQLATDSANSQFSKRPRRPDGAQTAVEEGVRGGRGPRPLQPAPRPSSAH